MPVLLFSISCLGFITDGNSKLVGSARIRQVRVKGDTCPISPRLKHVVVECHAPYSLQTEDTSLYGEHWNTSVFDNSSDLSSAWQYQSQSKLRRHPSWGKLGIYSGGGYVIHLGTDPKNASRYLLCSCKLSVHLHMMLSHSCINKITGYTFFWQNSPVPFQQCLAWHLHKSSVCWIYSLQCQREPLLHYKPDVWKQCFRWEPFLSYTFLQTASNAPADGRFTH